MKTQRYKPRRFSNQRAREYFVTCVKNDIVRIGTASDIRQRHPIGLFAALKTLIRPHFDRYAESVSHPINYDEWCDENIPPIIEEIENAE